LTPPEKIKRAAERTMIKKRRTAIMAQNTSRNAITNLAMVSPVSGAEIERQLFSGNVPLNANLLKRYERERIPSASRKVPKREGGIPQASL
jgi:hypothetical protein